jgi:hypothetical protein
MLIRLHSGPRSLDEVLFLDGEGNEIRRPRLPEIVQNYALMAAAATKDGGMLVGSFKWLGKLRPDGTPDPAFHEPDNGFEIRQIILQGEDTDLG